MVVTPDHGVKLSGFIIDAGPVNSPFQGYGLGSYSFFNRGVAIQDAMAFQAPDSPHVRFHEVFTQFLTGTGSIDSVINGTGATVNSSFHGSSDVVAYPGTRDNGSLPQ